MISIILCTYNRADLLPDAIKSLIAQDTDVEKFEILIVDNNSTDETPKLVESFAEQHSNIRYCKELTPGLSNARNKGLKEAKGDYVGYIDDDAEALPNWVSRANWIIENHLPDIFGGPYLPLYKTQVPDWYKYEYEVRNQEITDFVIDEAMIWGSNMFFKKSLLLEYGGFNPNLGMVGNVLYYGEESELVQRAIRESRKIFYDYHLQIKHLVPDFKMSFPYLFLRYYKLGVSAFEMAHKRGDAAQYIPRDSKTGAFEIQKIVDDITVGLDDLMQKEKKRSLTMPVESHLIEDVIIPGYYLLGIKREALKHISVPRNTLLKKIYRMNLETIVNSIRRIF